MRLNNFNQEVESIQFKRNNFLTNFSIINDDLFENLNTSRNDNELNSIRLHKYLTHTKVVGKVINKVSPLITFNSRSRH